MAATLASIFECEDLCNQVRDSLIPLQKSRTGLSKKRNPASPVQSNLVSISIRLSAWKKLWVPVRKDEDWRGLLCYLIGYEGFDTVQAKLAEIVEILHSLVEMIKSDEAHKLIPSNPTFSLLVTKRVKTMKSSPEQDKLNDSISTLDRRMSELETCADVSFSKKESERCPLTNGKAEALSIKSSATEIPLNSRLISVALFRSCLQWSENFGVSLDTLSSHTGPGHYHLLQNPASLDGMRKMTLDFSEAPAYASTGATEMVHLSELEGFPTGSLVRVPRQITDPGSVARVHRALSPLEISNSTKYESLESLLRQISVPKTLDGEGLLSRSERMNLAEQIARFAYQLLGTPWLANLQSDKIYRIKSNEKEPEYTLSFSTASLSRIPDLETIWNVSEASHINKVGVLLAELALCKPAAALNLKGQVPLQEKMKVLPTIKEKMGLHYYEAVVYCLREQRSWSFSNGDAKFESRVSDWQHSLADVLRDFDDNVLSKLSGRGCTG